MDELRTHHIAPPPRLTRSVTGVQLACTALVVSTAMLAGHPPRRAQLPELTQVVEWAARPATPAIDPPATASRPAEDTLAHAPLVANTRRDSEAAPTITRLAARTRLGGRFGP
jgi:hypothetical protein